MKPKLDLIFQHYFVSIFSLVFLIFQLLATRESHRFHQCLLLYTSSLIFDFNKILIRYLDLKIYLLFLHAKLLRQESMT